MKISFLIPGLPVNSGGHRNILRAAHWLEKFGHDVALSFIEKDASPKKIKDLINANFFPFDGEIIVGIDFKPRDIMFATQWKTAEMVAKSGVRAKVKAYFIQDYEPDFYPISSERFAAEMSYRQGLYHICHGKWLANKLRSQGHEAHSFDYTLSHDVYNPGPRTDFRKRVFLFGRPEMPRRCFELGGDTLVEIYKRDPEVQFNIAGSNETLRYTFPFPFNNKGHIDGKTAAEVYRNSDVGLAFSTINACGAAYDMMACGLPVLDVYWPGVEQHYGHGDFVLLTDPDPEIMAEAALKLMDDKDDWQRRSQGGREFTATIQTEEQMARQIEALIVEAVK
jgi:glycosyltransferase involved in cell wall biosynthesis